MAHIPFFYSSDLKKLDENSSHHFKNVLRKGIGDNLFICDGEGKIWDAIAKDFKDGKVFFDLLELKEIKEKPKISIATAIPKGQRIATLIEKTSEIGVDKIILLITKFSSVKIITEGMMRRFNSIAKAACMQSEKGFITKIEGPIFLKEAIEKFENIGICEKEGEKGNWLNFIKNGEILFIGPEGGWAKEEIKIFKEKEISVLPLTKDPLRIETAAIVALSFYYALKIC